MTTIEYVEYCRGLFQAQKRGVVDFGRCIGFDGETHEYPSVEKFEHAVIRDFRLFQQTGALERDITPEHALQLLNGD